MKVNYPSRLSSRRGAVACRTLRERDSPACHRQLFRWMMATMEADFPS